MNPIVRELVTKLSFALDKTNLVKFEKAIFGFKTQFTIAAGIFTGLVKKVLDFTQAAAQGVLQTKDIATYAGIAVEEFAALQNVAKKFNIPLESFNSAIQEIATGLKQAAFGEGRLVEIANRTFGAIDFRKANGDLLNAREYLFQIVEYLGRVKDESDKLAILGQIFSPEEAGKWARFLGIGVENIKKATENEREYGRVVAASTANAEQYLKDVANLKTEFEKLTQTIAYHLVPIVGNAFAHINDIIQSVKENGALFTAGRFIKRIGATIADLAPNEIPGFDIKKRYDVPNDWYSMNRNQTPTITNNNTIQIDVPPGTPFEQANLIADSVQRTLNNFRDQMAREIIVNHPTVE